jgi:hypothetical protein
VTLDRLTVRPTRSGAFEIAIGQNASAPDGVPRVGAEGAVDPLAYWRLNHTIADDNVDGATFEFVVDDTLLGDAPPDAVTLYRYEGGEWVASDPQVLATTNGSHRLRAHVAGLSVFAVGVRHAEVTVTDAGLGSSTVPVDDAVTVTATVRNDGTTAATRTLALEVGDERAVVRNVTVPAGEHRTVRLLAEPNRTGTYVVRVGNESAGELRVVAAETATATPAEAAMPDGSKPTPEEEVPVLLLISVLAVGLLSVGAAYYYRTRQGAGN